MTTHKLDGMSEEHFRSLGLIAEYAHRSGHTILGGINETQEGQTVRGYQIRAGGDPLYIESTIDQPFFTVKMVWRYSNLLSSNISEGMVDDQIEKMSTNEYSERKEVRDSIAQVRIRRNSEWIREKISKIEDMVLDFNSRMQYTMIPDEDDGEIPDGFWAIQKIYPRDEDFSCRDYDMSIQEIVRDQTKIGKVLREGAEDEFSLLDSSEEIETDQDANNNSPNPSHGSAYQ